MIAVMVACAAAPTGGVPTFLPEGRGQLTAALEGELAVRDGCLVVDTGTSTFAIAWDAGATIWHADENRIDVGDISAQVGDRVAVAGGEWPVPSLDDWDWVIAPSEGCLAQGGFWIAWSLEHL